MIETAKFKLKEHKPVSKSEILKCAAYGVGILGTGISAFGFIDYDASSNAIEDLSIKNREEHYENLRTEKKPYEITISPGYVYRLKEISQLEERRNHATTLILQGLILTIPALSIATFEGINNIKNKEISNS